MKILFCLLLLLSVNSYADDHTESNISHDVITRVVRYDYYPTPEREKRQNTFNYNNYALFDASGAAKVHISIDLYKTEVTLLDKGFGEKDLNTQGYPAERIKNSSSLGSVLYFQSDEQYNQLLQAIDKLKTNKCRLNLSTAWTNKDHPKKFRQEITSAELICK